MQFSIFAALALALPALAMPTPFRAASSAPALAERNDPYKADFRTFGVSGCHDDNQGVYTLLQSDIGACSQFPEAIGSLNLNKVVPECTLTLYADVQCTESPVVAPAQVCQNGGWKSYKITC